jgi:hypothetical protein
MLTSLGDEIINTDDIRRVTEYRDPKTNMQMTHIVWRDADRERIRVFGEMDETLWHITGTIVPAQPGFSIITGDFLDDGGLGDQFVYSFMPVIAFHIDFFEQPRPITAEGIVRNGFIFEDYYGRKLLGPGQTEAEKLESIERFKKHFEEAMRHRAADRAKKKAKEAAE